MNRFCSAKQSNFHTLLKTSDLVFSENLRKKFIKARSFFKQESYANPLSSGCKQSAWQRSHTGAWTKTKGASYPGNIWDSFGHYPFSVFLIKTLHGYGHMLHFSSLPVQLALAVGEGWEDSVPLRCCRKPVFMQPVHKLRIHGRPECPPWSLLSQQSHSVCQEHLWGWGFTPGVQQRRLRELCRESVARAPQWIRCRCVRGCACVCWREQPLLPKVPLSPESALLETRSACKLLQAGMCTNKTALK